MIGTALDVSIFVLNTAAVHRVVRAVLVAADGHQPLEESRDRFVSQIASSGAIRVVLAVFGGRVPLSLIHVVDDVARVVTCYTCRNVPQLNTASFNVSQGRYRPGPRKPNTYH